MRRVEQAYRDLRDVTDLIQVVVDDETVAKLRLAAEARGIGVEAMIVRLVVAAADHVDELLAAPPPRSLR